MFAIVAAVLFGVALILDVADQASDLVSTLTVAGLLSLALFFAVGTPWPWRRQP